MENPRLRMGVEIELHGVWFTFVRTDQANEFWPVLMNVRVEDTMMGHNPIFVPQAFPNTTAAQYIDTIDWEADWGFIVCGDNYQSTTDDVLGVAPALQVNYGQCCFELNTAAHFIKESEHWIIVRLCAQAFRDTLLEFHAGNVPPPPNGTSFFTAHELWYSVDDLLAAYNTKVDNLWAQYQWAANRNKWKLKRSYDLDHFLGGGYKGVIGQWAGYFVISRNQNMAYELWCDTQVNYQVDLAYLYDHTDDWIELWTHMWIHGVKPHWPHPTVANLDPADGHKKPANIRFVYRNQITAALWRAARDEARNIMAVFPDPAYSTGATASQVKALLMMMFAVGTVAPDMAAGTAKNSYSQLPKTSPSSIAGKIGGAAHNTAHQALVGTLGLSVVANYANARAAAMRHAQHLRPYLSRSKPINVTPPLGQLPLDSYRVFAGIDAILSGALHNNFNNMWRATFSAMAVPGQANTYGYTAAAPFYCYWALAHTSRKATRYTPSGKVKVLFESRYGHNRLNVGFNPDAGDEAFYHAYRSLLMLTLPTNSERMARLASLKLFSTSASRKQFRKQIAKGQSKGEH